MITGTFLDEISHDIPSANWGRDEWAHDFAQMRADGIDTVILIRAGYKDRATFDSKTLRSLHSHLLVEEDLVALYLELAEQHGMDLWFGTYDSGQYWHSGQHMREADLNIAFCDEVWQRYGRSGAFRGWYVCHEIDAFDPGVMAVYQKLAGHLKRTTGLPILISPYFRGANQFDQTLTLEQHAEEWKQVFQKIQGYVDVVAFQDGNVEFRDLPRFLAINSQLAKDHGVQSWSNIETFDRDVHIKFPPIAWPKLRHKIQCALDAKVDKLITFEYSHFLSPNSMFPSAHTLHTRWREWMARTR